MDGFNGPSGTPWPPMRKSTSLSFTLGATLKMPDFSLIWEKKPDKIQTFTTTEQPSRRPLKGGRYNSLPSVPTKGRWGEKRRFKIATCLMKAKNLHCFSKARRWSLLGQEFTLEKCLGPMLWQAFSRNWQKIMRKCGFWGINSFFISSPFSILMAWLEATTEWTPTGWT